RVWQRRLSGAQALFSFANLTVAVWFAGTLFFKVAGVEPLFASKDIPSSGLLLPLGAFAATYYVVNSGLSAIVIALARRRTIVAVFREHFVWLGPGYAAGACVALLFVAALHQVR